VISTKEPVQFFKWNHDSPPHAPPAQLTAREQRIKRAK
jgi:hypothetical protein